MFPLRLTLSIAATLLIATSTAFSADKPNIVVIWGDDTGMTNVSAYGHGLVGYKTPNIDRIAKEGVMFTDYYTENSCTAGALPSYRASQYSVLAIVRLDCLGPSRE